MFLERVGSRCRLSGCLLSSMMGLDNVLLRQLSVRMFSQSLFTFFKKAAIDGWNCVMKVMKVMKVMRLSLVFWLKLYVKVLFRVICEAWLICCIHIYIYMFLLKAFFSMNVHS